MIPFVLVFDANEDTMIARIIERGKTSGRSDDNEESLKLRFATFKGESVPIIEHFEKLGKVRKVDALPTVEEIFATTAELFKDFA